jgi:hypothetical protein
LIIKDYDDNTFGAGCSLFGRTIAKAWGRDSDAKLGDDIIWLSGIYRSGGSMKNWKTEIREGNFIIKNFPLPSTELPSVKKAIEEGWCEIKFTKKKRTAEEIQADIEKYEAILSELKNELNSL